MTDQLSFSDLVTIVLSLGAVLFAGLYGARSHSSANATSFILAGRSLTLPVFVASLVATWYGSVLGATEFIVQYGVVFILCFGVPYYVIATIYALWLSKRIRQSQAISIPDQFRVVYGSRAATVAGILMLVITIPASYQLSLAIITQSFTGWSLGISLFVSSAFAFVYVIKGGLRSDAYANLVQAVLMYVGYTALVVYCLLHLGSLSWLVTSTPSQLLTLPGPLGWTPIVVWCVIAMQTFIDPNFHVRTAAASSVVTARRGIMISVAAWIVFDVLQLLVGLYALSSVAYGTASGAQAAVSLALNVLPDVWRGMFVAGLIAAIMSALDGYALVSGTLLGHDLLPVRNGDEPIARVRLGVAVSLVVGGLVAFALPSVIDLLYRAASITVPAVLAPLLVSYTRHAPRIQRGIVSLIIFPAVASLSVMLLPVLGCVLHSLVEPMLVGILVSVLILAILIRSHDNATSTR